MTHARTLISMHTSLRPQVDAKGYVGNELAVEAELTLAMAK